MKRKLILDILMTAIMVCLLNTNLTGLLVHELLGIGIFFLFVLHKLLNLKWIKAVTRNLFRKSLKPRTRLLYSLDVLLLILATANVVTGVLVSTRVLAFISAKDIYVTSLLHHFLAYSLMLVLAIHVALHWAMIRGGMKLRKGGITENLLCTLIAAALAFVLLGSNTVKKFLVLPQRPESNYPAQLEVPPYMKEMESTVEEEEDEEEETDAPEEIPSEPAILTLEQFLSNLVCTGCGRRCLLSNPACGTGRRQQEEAIQTYNDTYQVNETYASQEWDNWEEDYNSDWTSDEGESSGSGHSRRPGRGNH